MENVTDFSDSSHSQPPAGTLSVSTLVGRQMEDRRKLGKLSPSLRAQLRACNTLQLKTVKALCARFITDHRNAPDPGLCGKPYTEEVLVSIPVRNKRYQLEIRNRPDKTHGRIYFNGPYVYAYYRDGKYIREQYFKKRNWRNLPRKVLAAIKPFRDEAAVQKYFDKIAARYTSEANTASPAVDESINLP